MGCEERDVVGGLRVRVDFVGGQLMGVAGDLKMDTCTETECFWPEHIHLLLEIAKLVLYDSM